MIRGNVNYDQVRDNLRKVIGDLNVTSRQLALMAGIDASNFNKKLKGDLNLTQKDFKKLEKIHISTDFLLTGEGSMYTGKVGEAASTEIQQSAPKVIVPTGIPVYDEEFACGFSFFDNPALKPVSYAELPGTRGATCWCKATGHSMEPLISHGDYVCLKKIEDWQDFVVFGDCYAVDTVNEMRAIKKIGRGANDEEYTLVSVNEDYAPQPIKIKLIRAMFKVVAVTKFL